MAAVKVAYALFLTILIGCSTAEMGKAQMGAEDQPDCKADLMTTGQYVLILKGQRDRYEEEIARLRYQVDKLKEENSVLRQQTESERKKK